jgi:tetratricopeptide (TPR) repeat protein
MKAKFIFLLGVILTVLAVIIVLMFIPSSDLNKADGIIGQLEEVKKRIINGEESAARKLLNSIDVKKLKQPSLLIKLAENYFLLGENKTSRKILENAWSKGMKEPATVQLLMASDTGKSKEEQYAYICRFLDELPDTRSNTLFRAEIYYRLDHKKDAEKIWLRYFNDKTISSEKRGKYVRRAIQCRILDNDLSGASELLDRAYSQGCMTLPLYNLATSLYLLNGNREKSEKFLEEAKKRYTSEELQLKDAMISLYMGNLDKALNKLNEIQMPSTSSISDLVVQYNARMYLALLRVMQSGKDAFFLDLIYNSKESSRYLEGNRGRSRLLSLYISPEILESEVLFYKALSDVLKNKTDAVANFKLKNDLFPNHPVVDFIVLKLALLHDSTISSVAKVRKYFSTGKLSIIEGIHGLFILSPPVTAEIAQILYSLGAYKDAEALLSSLEGRSKYTAKTINMLLKVALQTNNKKLLDALLQLKNIDKFVDLEVLMLIGKRPDLLSRLSRKGVFKVILLANNGKIDKALTLADSLQLPGERLTLLKAEIYALAGNNVKAETLFKRSLNAENNFWGYREYASYLMRTGKVDAALKLYREILSDKKDDVSALIGEALCLDLAGDLDKAIEQLNKHLVNANPYILLTLAKLNIKKGNYPLGLRYADKVLTVAGKNNEAVFYKTVALIGIYQQYPTDQNRMALKKMSEFLKRDAGEKDNLLFTAYIESLYSLKEYKTLLDITSAIHSDESNIWLIKKRILSFIYLGDIDNAEKLLSANRAKLDKNFLILVDSEFYAAKKEYMKAIALLRKSENRPLRYKAAKLAVKAGKSELSLEIMKNISPTYLEWGGLGDIAGAEKNLSLAFQCYEEALKLAPENPLILNNYVWLALNSGKLPEKKILTMIRKAYRLTPTNGILETYLSVLMKYGKEQEAEDVLKDKHTLKNAAPGVILKYLQILEKSGKSRERILVFNSILKRDDSFWTNYPLSRKKIEAELLKLKMRKDDN